jgi:hypothetical protein
MTRNPNAKFRRALGGSLVVLALLLGAGTASAQACAAFDTMSKQLEQRYAEVPVAAGLAQTGKLLQVFAAKDGSTWTVILTRPDGLSCIVAAGRHWQMTVPKPGSEVYASGDTRALD